MRPELLHVVAPISNPIRWKSRIKLAERWVEHMLDSGVKVLLVECATGERPMELGHLKHVQHVGVRSRTLVWTKENLLNIGMARLPDDAKYIGWFDADIEFTSNRSWASDTVNALQQYDVVQPWSDCYDLGPDGEHMEIHRSFARIWHERKPIMQGPNAGKSPYMFAHSGFAWAATRHALDAVGGLMDTAALGAADHHMAMALIGRVRDSIPRNLHPSYFEPLVKWEQRARHAIAGNLGYVKGTIVHAFHGAKPKRAYVDRWEILRKHGFNPNTDLVRNTYGVIELAGNKPELRHDLDRYFRQRDEDSNSL